MGRILLYFTVFGQVRTDSTVDMSLLRPYDGSYGRYSTPTPRSYSYNYININIRN